MSDAHPHRGRKKTLTGPPYTCSFPSCTKTFQRSEHLSRHRLNHNPKTIFSCAFPHCPKTFVRHDLLVRHMKRHSDKAARAASAEAATAGHSQYLVNVVSKTLPDHPDTPFYRSPASAPAPTPASELHHTQNNTQITSQNASPLPPPTQQQQSDPTANLNLFGWLFPEATNEQHSQHQLQPQQHDQQQQSQQQSQQSQSQQSQHSQQQHIPPIPAYTTPQTNTPGNFLTDLNEFNFNTHPHNLFIIQDSFSPTPSSAGHQESATPEAEIVITKDKSLNDNTQIQQHNHIHSHNHNQPHVQPLHSFQHSQGQQASDFSLLTYDDGILYKLSQDQINEFESLIPALKSNSDFTKPKLEKALKTYWNFFHPRFPMLHRPTFNATQSPILLLAAMIVIGSKLFMCVDNITCPDNMKIKHPNILSDTISEPLRWLLFASPFFQPPAEVWIIQSLLMLEFYEKHCTTRRLHERSHLHHGTTIQLLRRSPTLGGAPTKYNNESNNSNTHNQDLQNWHKWIEVESMKRATFMCFYMDAIDAICLGHQMFIYSHQIQMTMPVDDVIWESNLSQFNKNFKLYKRPKQFLLVLRNIMNGKPTKTNSFGKKILLAGLSAILFQIQQRDLQLFFGLDKFTNTISENWRDLLTAALAIWRNDVGDSCCSSKSAIDNLNSLGNSSQFSTTDTRCKCIAYHLAHIYMSISHYDIFIVCGAPWRMNVKPSSPEERQAIKQRVIDWSATRHAHIAIVQCYLALFEMFLSPQDGPYAYHYDYLPDADLFFRSYSIGYMLLVLWSYNHVKGAYPITDKNKERVPAYEYLHGIRGQMTELSGGVQLHTWHSMRSGTDFYGDLMKVVNIVGKVDGMFDLVSLLEMVGEKFIIAEFKVVRELGKLLLFCKNRCTGDSKDELLDDMYIVD